MNGIKISFFPQNAVKDEEHIIKNTVNDEIVLERAKRSWAFLIEKPTKRPKIPQESPLPLFLLATTIVLGGKSLTIVNGQPWINFCRFLELSHKRHIWIAYAQNPSHRLVRVKCFNYFADISLLQSSKKPDYQNVAEILRIYVDGGTIFTVCKHQSNTCTVSQIFSSTMTLEEPHLAALCVKVNLLPLLYHFFLIK